MNSINDLGKLSKAVTALRLVKASTAVPVPEVLYYDDTHSICDADYFFMEKLSGESFYKLKTTGMPMEEQDKIYHEIGRYNREMNEITGTHFGYLGQPFPCNITWRDAFCSMLEGILTDGETIDIGLGIDYDEVREVVQKASPALDQVMKPSFVHWDLWDGNVFVSVGRVNGIIDFERALWGDPLLEYYFRSHSINESFDEGYGAKLRGKAPVRALLYDIYLYLILVIESKYRRYPDDGQYTFGVKELKNAVDKIKEFI